MSQDRRGKRARAKKRRIRSHLATMKLRRLIDFSRRTERPNRVTSIGPLEIMRSRQQISEEAHFAAIRFAGGWEVKNGSVSIGAAPFEYQPTSGRPLAPQERHLALARDFELACVEMDYHDRMAGRRPITRYVLQGVACELMSLEQIDRLIGIRKGWSRQRLGDGLSICVRLWRRDLTIEQQIDEASA